VSPPAFPLLDEVSADLAATQASWGSYRDFLQERDSMAHKDWLSVRDQVRTSGKIVRFRVRNIEM
jgi:dynein heavy chain 2